MKKFFFAPMALFALLVAVSSCINEQERVERVAFGYLDATYNYRFDEAKPFATQITCDSTLDLFKAIVATMDTAAINREVPAKITLCGSLITSDSTASVAYVLTTPTKQLDVDSVYLFKENGRWLVDEVVQIPAFLRPVLNKQLKGFKVK